MILERRDDMNTTEIIIYIALTVLLPILPAYILYKALGYGRAPIVYPITVLNQPYNDIAQIRVP